MGFRATLNFGKFTLKLSMKTHKIRVQLQTSRGTWNS